LTIVLSPALQGLSLLSQARSKASEYYAPLLDSDDEVLKIGAWCALLDRDQVTADQFPRVVELASHGAIQSRAFRFFQANWEHELAAEVAAKIATSEASAEALVRRADLACDDLAAVEAQRYRFLATGKLEALVAMLDCDERAAGWRPALALGVNVLVLHPHDPAVAHRLLQLLYGARQIDMLDAVIELFEASNLHPYLALLYGAASKLVHGEPQSCLALLARFSAMRPPRPDIMLRTRPTALQLNAEAIENLGDYRKAYEAYAELNGIDHGKPVSLDDFATVILRNAQLPVPRLPPDPHTNHFVMAGFPRSGTTLLENALAAHPQIETFEEIPSSAAMQRYLDRAVPEVEDEADAVRVYQHARARYYDEELRRTHKPGVKIFIDKLPMRSAEAAFMSRIFPDKRYIFSIRHPYDVVLSCFKQYFGRNIAMEHFRRMDTAVKLYDFTMDQWFSAFSMNDPRVHYLRYDTLVTAFEPSLHGVLEFLGLPWDDAVQDFSKAAENRAAKTPSYQKVRQGLGIGVQTQWRNYGFIFQSDVAKPLRKWVEFFGYPLE
jgi:tetratricopeptide (TPR) repeat protein